MAGYFGIIVFMLSAFVSGNAWAAKITIDKQTPAITPTESIYQFPEIDWDKVEARQDAGKDNRDHVVMMCDDTYLSLVEVKLPEGLDKSISIDSECKLRGAYFEQFSPAWLQFEGPDSDGCMIKVEKKRSGGKRPLVVEYELSEAC